jgi:AraC-like DNA-binding protein
MERIINSMISIILITIIPLLLFILTTSYLSNEKFDISLKVSNNFNSDFLYVFTLISPISFLFFPQLIYGQNQSSAIYLILKELYNTKFKGACQEFNADIEKSPDIGRIIAYIDNQKPYLNPTFSLHSISSELNIPHLHVSSCLNKVLNVSFPEYRNQKRVEYAIQLFRENKHLHMSIEGISDQCGFKSKSSFYLAFRAVYQMTPTEWIAKNL